MSFPILQSLLLADHVYRDQSTGKHVICGVFSTIFFSPNPPVETPESGKANQPRQAGGAEEGASPGPSAEGHSDQPGKPQNRPTPIQSVIQAGSPYVYFSLTELRGRRVLEVRYVELNDNRVLFQIEVPIECDDPLKTIEISLPLPRLPLVALEERSYALEVLCEGQPLGSHRVLARISPGTQPPQ